MDNSRLQDYLNLINTLLSCPNGEEAQVLSANQGLVDAGLVQSMLHRADYLTQVAHQLAEELELSSLSPTLEFPLDFIWKIYQLTVNSECNLQDVYSLLQENLNELDDNFAALLRNLTADTLSQDLAVAIGTFSNIIRQFLPNFPLNNQSSLLEISITGYELVSQVFTRRDSSQLWAENQMNLGTAYSDRRHGKTEDNLERSISYFEEALQVYTYEDYPIEYADTLNNLGITYYKRINAKRQDNLDRALSYSKAALEVYSNTLFVQRWADIQINLGNIHSDCIQENRAENLEAAIHYYQAALWVYTTGSYPEKWADIQLSLGNVYRERIWGEKAENCEAAIRHIKAALKVYTRKSYPEKWATVHHNLGNVYCQRIQGEKAENLEDAIRCFKAALKVQTSKTSPAEWAMTKNSLGVAYRNRVRGGQAENLEAAIRCYKAALKIRLDEALPEELVETQNNLGIAYLYRIKGEKPENLKQAISYLKAALNVCERENLRPQAADTLINLGNACSSNSLYGIQEKKVESLEFAIRCYKAALEVHTFQAYPERWATIQIGLGNAYHQCIQGKKLKNLEAAISYFNAALKVYTREAFPQEYAKTQYNLGRVYQDAQDFPNAHSAYAAAIKTIESLRGEIILGFNQDKQRLAEEYNQVYQGMVEVCVKLGEYKQAWEYAERSKARNLVELILTRDRHSIFNTAIADRLQELEVKIANAQYDLQTARVGDPTALAKHLQELRQERNKLQDENLPIGSGSKFDKFQASLDKNTAIIEWYITSAGFETFIITRHSLERLILPTPADALKDLIDWTNEYLGTLDAYNRGINDQFKNSLDSLLSRLAKILYLDISKADVDKHQSTECILHHIPKNCDRLILIPHRVLHLLPLHALPLTSGELLCQRFHKGVGYVPSCQLLQQVQARKRAEFSRLFAIQNPTEDFTLDEVEVIRQHFDPNQVLVLSKGDANKANIECNQHPQNDLRVAHCVHFSCHGYFNTNPGQANKSALILADAKLDSEPIELYPERHLVSGNAVYDLDKCLTLDAIFTLNLSQCRLVTLSACETGLTDFNSLSDEYIGLPSGFLIAGSPNVVSSLWRVHQLSTALLMIKFYENLQTGSTVAVALNTAQNLIKDASKAQLQQWTDQLCITPTQREAFSDWFDELGSIEKPLQSPYYWAAFCAIGQ